MYFLKHTINGERGIIGGEPKGETLQRKYPNAIFKGVGFLILSVLQKRAFDTAIKLKNPKLKFRVFLCGERGIRTPGPVTVNSFQDCRNRPLCHFSSMFASLL